MSSTPLESRDELIAAVRSLIKEVQGLSEKLSLYAPREEVSRESKMRAWRFFSLAVAIIIASQMLTTTMISYCFLDANNTHKVACNAIPGYGEAVEQNEVRLGRFESLLTGVERTSDRLDRIEERLDKLEGAGK